MAQVRETLQFTLIPATEAERKRLATALLPFAPSGSASQLLGLASVSVTVPSSAGNSQYAAPKTGRTIRRRKATRGIACLPGPYRLVFRGSCYDPEVYVVTASGDKIAIVKLHDRLFFYELAQAWKESISVSYRFVCGIYPPKRGGRVFEEDMSEGEMRQMAYSRVSRVRERLEKMRVDPDGVFDNEEQKGYYLINRPVGLGSVKTFSSGDLRDVSGTRDDAD